MQAIFSSARLQGPGSRRAARAQASGSGRSRYSAARQPARPKETYRGSGRSGPRLLAQVSRWTPGRPRFRKRDGQHPRVIAGLDLAAVAPQALRHSVAGSSLDLDVDQERTAIAGADANEQVELAPAAVRTSREELLVQQLGR